MNKQKSIRDLERQIQTLAKIMKSGFAVTSREGVVVKTAGGEAPAEAAAPPRPEPAPVTPPATNS